MDRAVDFKEVSSEIVDTAQSVDLVRLSDVDLVLIGGGCGEVIFPHNS